MCVGDILSRAGLISVFLLNLLLKSHQYALCFYSYRFWVVYCMDAAARPNKSNTVHRWLRKHKTQQQSPPSAPNILLFLFYIVCSYPKHRATHVNKHTAGWRPRFFLFFFTMCFFMARIGVIIGTGILFCLHKQWAAKR